MQITSVDIAADTEITVDYGAAFWMRQKGDTSQHQQQQASENPESASE
jgi:hypothetical protein